MKKYGLILKIRLIIPEKIILNTKLKIHLDQLELGYRIMSIKSMGMKNLMMKQLT